MSEIIATPQLVQDRLVEVFEKITGLAGRVIVETKTDIRPNKGLYASLHFRNIDFLTQNEARFEMQDDELKQIQRNEATQEVVINFWGDGAYFKAIEAWQELQQNERNFDLWDILGYNGVSTVQDLSNDFGAKIQQRASFTFSFSVAYEKSYNVENIESTQWRLSSPVQNYSEEYEQGVKKDEPNCDLS